MKNQSTAKQTNNAKGGKFAKKGKTHIVATVEVPRDETLARVQAADKALDNLKARTEPKPVEFVSPAPVVEITNGKPKAAPLSKEEAKAIRAKAAKTGAGSNTTKTTKTPETAKTLCL